MKFEKDDVWGFEHAIRGMKAKGYRKTKNGYETFCSNKGKTVSLGTYKNEADAKQAIYNYRKNRFVNQCSVLGLNPFIGVEYKQNYIVFPSGHILNLHGHEMIGHIDKSGYRNVIINNQPELVHRIIASVFIENPNGKEQVNHINGIKYDNRIENLEWCSRSDNLIHAYKLGLEKPCFGEKHHMHKLTNEDIKYIRSVYKKNDKNFGSTALAKKFNVDRTTISDVANNVTWRNVI